MTRAGIASNVRYATVLCVVTAGLVGALIGVALTTTTPVPGVMDVSGVVSVAIPIVRVLLDMAAITTIGMNTGIWLSLPSFSSCCAAAGR